MTCLFFLFSSVTVLMLLRLQLILDKEAIKYFILFMYSVSANVNRALSPKGMIFKLSHPSSMEC